MNRKSAQRKTIEPNAWTRYAPLAVCIFIAAAVAVVFGQTIDHDFVNYDDKAYVYANPDVIQGLTSDGVVWAFKTGCATNWHPLTWLSHQLDCQLYGLNAGGHHATSVLLHAATAILLFLVLWRMTGDLWPSAFVAAVFAIHPLRVESVAWVAERKDVLSGLFFVLTLAAYLHYVRQPTARGRYLIVVAVFALGLMSKPMLVTVPFVLLLLDYWPLGRMVSADSKNPGFSIPSRLLIEKIPLFLLAIVSCVVTSLVQVEAAAKIDKLPLASRVGNALVSYVVYLRQLVWPADLAVFYPHPGNGLPDWKIIASLLVLLGISAGALICRRRIPSLIVGWLWYLGMLVPVIGLLQVGSQAHADRYTYLPQIGLLIGLAWGANRMAAAWPYRRWTFGIVSALVVAVLMGCAWHQTTFWLNSESLWRHTLKCTTDDNGVAHTNLGEVLRDPSQLEEGVQHLQKALAISPSDVDARVNLGFALAKLGRIDKAVEQYWEVLRNDPSCMEAHYNLAVALARLGRLDQAIPEYEVALKIDPKSVDAHANIAVALELVGRIDEATEHYRQALDLAMRQNKQQLAEDVKARLRKITGQENRPGG